jgi:SAM-dependent methyltransferase
VDHDRVPRHYKRQRVSYPYEVGDRVLMLVPRNDSNPQTDSTAGDLSNLNAAGKLIAAGGVVKNLQEGKDLRPNETCDKISIQDPAGKKRVVVDVVTSTSTSNCCISGTSVSFTEKEQQRLLQPNFSAATMPTSKTVVIMVPETAPFRQVAQFQLHPHTTCTGDRVLEIGCSTGEMSKRLWRMGVQAWVGMDNSVEMVQRCFQQLKQHISSKRKVNDGASYSVLKVDPLLEHHRAYDATIHALGGPPTAICLDIGGNRDVRPVMQVLSWVFKFFVEPDSSAALEEEAVLVEKQPPRLIIIKSRELVRNVLQEGNEGKVSIEHVTGMILDGKKWFETTRSRLDGEDKQHGERGLLHLKQIKHPAKAPMAYSPKDGTTPICRYHNYHQEGCKRHNDPVSPCPFDHNHCHACRQPGHIAMNCTEDCIRY